MVHDWLITEATDSFFGSKERLAAQIQALEEAGWEIVTVSPIGRSTDLQVVAKRPKGSAPAGPVQPSHASPARESDHAGL